MSRKRSRPIAGTGRQRLAGNKDMNKLLRRVRKAGGHIELDRGTGHGYKVWGPKGGPVTITTTRSSSQRTTKNVRAKLRGIGLNV